MAVVAGSVLGGGLITAMREVWTARKTVPAERDSVVATGAETAVSSLMVSLKAETARANRAEAERDHLLERVGELESQLKIAQGALDEANRQMSEIRKEISGA